MPKVKSHASWNGLSAEQQDTLEQWLFDEKLSYVAVLERAQKELGFSGSKSSLQRFYQHREQERMLEGFARSEQLMASVNRAPGNAEALRSSGMKVAAQVFFRQVTEKPEEPRVWLPLAKLLAQCEKNEASRAGRDQENEIRLATLQFARVRFQYDTIGEAMRSLPKLLALKQAQEEEEMTVYQKNKRLNDVRRRMFGDVIPELLPENEEEEAHPEIIERRFQAGQRRRQEQFEREYRERQREQAKREAGKERQNVTEGKGAKTARLHKPAGETVSASENDSSAEAEFEKEQEPEGAAESELQSGPEAPSEAQEVVADEPRRLTPEERQKEYEELMRRARGLRRWRGS